MGVPHLIHIGFPKAGSTFLQEWFTRHPEICHTPGGIGGFRDLYGVCDFGANPRPPQTRCFVTSEEGLSAPHRDTDVTELAGSIHESPQFIKRNQERMCAVLRDLFPNGQILIVTRGFRGLVESGYSQLVRTGATVSPHEMFALFESSEAQQSDDNNPFDFDFIIDLYERGFGAENVMVLPFELLRDNESAFLGAIEKRLGLSHIELDIGRANPSLSPAELYWYPRISKRVEKIGNGLGVRGARKVHAWQVNQTMHNRWRRAIKLLEGRWPDKKVTSADFPGRALESCRGKADSLKGNPLYAPYAADYMWE